MQIAFLMSEHEAGLHNLDSGRLHEYCDVLHKNQRQQHDTGKPEAHKVDFKSVKDLFIPLIII